MNTKVLFSSASDHWATPAQVYEELNKEFHFNDDPCPLHGLGDLERSWGTSTFVNPPYSAVYSWMQKANEEAKMGKTVVVLVPSRTGTKWFHNFALKAYEIRFLKGRLKFGGAKNSTPFPSCLVIFR